jgi:hypothetical protein
MHNDRFISGGPCIHGEPVRGSGQQWDEPEEGHGEKARPVADPNNEPINGKAAGMRVCNRCFSVVVG